MRLTLTSIFLFCVFNPTSLLAEEYFRCSTRDGESRVVQHIETLPDQHNWTCESFQLITIEGEEENPDTDPESTSSEDQGTDTSIGNQGERNLPVAMQGPDDDLISLEQATKLNEDLKKEGVEGFEDEKEIEALVDACRGGAGHECTTFMRSIMSKIAPKRKLKSN